MHAIGVDIGGTYIKIGLVNNEGNIISQRKIKTLVDKPKECLDTLSKTILDLIKDKNIKVTGVGIGMPGILKDGTLIGSANLKEWLGINVANYINKKTGIKTLISNDANTAILGEARFGAAKGKKNVIMLTLGTGIGGGIIINNELYEGNKGQGAELGHLTICVDGEKCRCGRKGCLEAYVSATALTSQTIQEMKNNKKSIMWELVDNKLENVDASIPFKAEKLGDSSAKKVINNYVKYLSEGILSLCNIFRPEMILLSGGVAKQKENLINRVKKYLEKYSYGIKGTEKVIVNTACLGYDSGIIGAASLFFKI